MYQQLQDDYKKNGFAKVPVIFFDGPEFKKLSENVIRLADKKFPEGSGFSRNAWLGAPDIIEFVCNKKVVSFLQNFLGPNIGIFGASFYIKRAATNFEVPWHSDLSNYADEFEGIQALSLTIAITDCTKKEGCLEYAVGSHSKRKREHVYGKNPDNSLFGKDEHYELSEAEISSLGPSSYMELKSKEASICDIGCVHRSAPNTSDQDRVILVLRYFSTSKDQQITEKGIGFLKNARMTFLVLGQDELGVCRHKLVPG